MKKMILTLSSVALLFMLAGCQNNDAMKNVRMNPEKQEREFMRDAIRHHSPDVQRVDIIDSTLVYTHIYEGIIDVKTYTFVGDVCVTAERLYTFPSQMSALRHYRDAIEKAELYDDIEIFNNQVKYKLKEAQYKMETKGLTKEQLKDKFDKQINDAKADLKKGGQYIENDLKCCEDKVKDHHRLRHNKK